MNSFTNCPDGPLVSVLIPARNEARNINRILDSLSIQTYSRLEVVVCDDNSEDDTAAIVAKYTGSLPVKLITGKPLPEGWKGKAFACHQLSEAAEGEIFLFLDADVSCESEAVAALVSAFRALKADALTVFPKQLCVSGGEKLVVPVMDMLLYYFLPVPLASLFSSPSFSAATGQCFAFTRAAYRTAGGHEAVKDEVLEDIMLARRLKFAQQRLKILSGLGSLNCRMYRSWREVRDGFSKNFFAIFEYKLLPFVLFMALFQLLYLIPLIALVVEPSPLAVTSCCLLLLCRLIHAVRFGYPPLWAVLGHPLTCILVLFIAVRSWQWHTTGRSTWKGRILPSGK